MKTLLILTLLITILQKSLNVTERYNYKIIFENMSILNLNDPTSYNIPNSISNWGLAFWARPLNYLATSPFYNILIIDNGTFQYNFILDTLNSKIFFNNVFLTDIFINQISVFDIDNLTSKEKGWFFINLNYTFNHFSVFLNNNIITNQTTTSEYLAAQNTKIYFKNNNNPNKFHFFFVNVHFFNQAIPFSDIEEIKTYPRKVLGLYKFNDLSNNSDLIINLIDFSKRQNIKIKNQNKIPFHQNGSFVATKINFPLLNRNFAFKNLIICITGSIVFRNFIKDNNSFEDKYWIINWYNRKSEGNTAIFGLYTRLSYSTITFTDHIVLFESLISQNNNINPSFVSSSNFNTNLGDWTRQEIEFDIMTIVQINEEPQPNNQPQIKLLRCLIPELNYNEVAAYSFDLSFYDQHFFHIQSPDFTQPILYYYKLKEILITSSNKLDYVIDKDEVYLDLDKKILVKCSEGSDLLRSKMNQNDVLLMDQCFKNNSKFKCPVIPGCLFCIAGICEICLKNFVKTNANTCVECIYPDIIFNNECYVSKKITYQDLINLDIDYHNNMTIGLNVKLTYLKQYSNLNQIVTRKSTLYYNKNDFNFEPPSNLMNLLNSSEFILVEFYYKVFNQITTTKRDFQDNFGCPLNMLFNPTGNFTGECISSASCTGRVQENNFCINPLYDCLTQNTIENRCKVCQNGSTYYPIKTSSKKCLPLIMVDTQDATNNQIDSLFQINNSNRLVCQIENCDLCDYSGIVCYFCIANYYLLNQICLQNLQKNLFSIQNCSEYTLIGDCLVCNEGFQNYNFECLPEVCFSKRCFDCTEKLINNCQDCLDCKNLGFIEGIVLNCEESFENCIKCFFKYNFIFDCLKCKKNFTYYSQLNICEIEFEKEIKGFILGHLESNIFYKTCKNGYYYNTVTFECDEETLDCEFGCIQCLYINKICLECAINFTLIDFQCILNPNGKTALDKHSKYFSQVVNFFASYKPTICVQNIFNITILAVSNITSHLFDGASSNQKFFEIQEFYVDCSIDLIKCEEIQAKQNSLDKTKDILINCEGIFQNHYEILTNNVNNITISRDNTNFRCSNFNNQSFKVKSNLTCKNSDCSDFLKSDEYFILNNYNDCNENYFINEIENVVEKYENTYQIDSCNFCQKQVDFFCTTKKECQTQCKLQLISKSSDYIIFINSEESTKFSLSEDLIRKSLPDYIDVSFNFEKQKLIFKFLLNKNDFDFELAPRHFLFTKNCIFSSRQTLKIKNPFYITYFEFAENLKVENMKFAVARFVTGLSGFFFIPPIFYSFFQFNDLFIYYNYLDIDGGTFYNLVNKMKKNTYDFDKLFFIDNYYDYDYMMILPKLNKLVTLSFFDYYLFIGIFFCLILYPICKRTKRRRKENRKKNLKKLSKKKKIISQKNFYEKMKFKILNFYHSVDFKKIVYYYELIIFNEYIFRLPHFHTVFRMKYHLIDLKFFVFYYYGFLLICFVFLKYLIHKKKFIFDKNSRSLKKFIITGNNIHDRYLNFYDFIHILINLVIVFLICFFKDFRLFCFISIILFLVVEISLLISFGKKDYKYLILIKVITCLTFFLWLMFAFVKEIFEYDFPYISNILYSLSNICKVISIILQYFLIKYLKKKHIKMKLTRRLKNKLRIRLEGEDCIKEKAEKKEENEIKEKKKNSRVKETNEMLRKTLRDTQEIRNRPKKEKKQKFHIKKTKLQIAKDIELKDEIKETKKVIKIKEIKKENSKQKRRKSESKISSEVLKKLEKMKSKSQDDLDLSHPIKNERLILILKEVKKMKKAYNYPIKK